ncbi:MAG: DNA repair protein RecO [Candidatus Marinimicrobia bacterium]|nr:DNA repair protein RecO [Candidatus Neomarinimicrobiota bacterium]
MIEKAEAVVLKTLNHGDTSKIITLYSREVGRLKLIAKGVRSPKSKAMGLFQPTRHIQVIYYAKSTSDLQLFKSGELVNGFFGLEEDFDRLTLAQVMVELLDRSVEDEESHPRLFQLLVDSLSRLSNRKIASAEAYWFFHTHLLNELGFQPHVGRCSVCRDALDEGGSLGRGSSQLECVKCHQPGQDSIFVSGPVLKTIQTLSDTGWKDVQKTNLNARERRTLWDFLWQFTFHHIESARGMKSLKVLRQLYG